VVSLLRTMQYLAGPLAALVALALVLAVLIFAR
jgi:hypothetical protein